MCNLKIKIEIRKMKFFKNLLKKTRSVQTKLRWQKNNIHKIVGELEACQIALYVIAESEEGRTVKNNLIDIELLIEQAKFTAYKLEGITGQIVETSNSIVSKVNKFAPPDDELDLGECLNMTPEEFVLLFMERGAGSTDRIHEDTFHALYTTCSGKKISKRAFNAEVSSIIDRRDGHYYLGSIMN